MPLVDRDAGLARRDLLVKVGGNSLGMGLVECLGNHVVIRPCAKRNEDGLALFALVGDRQLVNIAEFNFHCCLYLELSA